MAKTKKQMSKQERKAIVKEVFGKRTPKKRKPKSLTMFNDNDTRKRFESWLRKLSTDELMDYSDKLLKAYTPDPLDLPSSFQANSAEFIATPPTPLFDQRASATLERCEGIYRQRGGEYSDTWRECRFLAMKAVARQLGIEIPDAYYRALATAAFVDMKHERLSGGYKDDSIIDGINYAAFLADEMRELQMHIDNTSTPTTPTHL